MLTLIRSLSTFGFHDILMWTMKKLNVIVPIYNVENYLKPCLDSLLAQTYLDFSVSLVNDGTQDSSRRIAQTYVDKYPDLFNLMDKENGGLSDARNYGLDKSSAEYVSFIDADDYIHPTMFEKMMRLFDEHIDVVACDMIYVYPDGRSEISSAGKDSLLDEQYGYMLLNNSACNKIYRRSLFVSERFIKGRWYEDLATIPCVLSKAKGIRLIHEGLYYYVQRDGSIAHTQNPKMFDIYWAIQHIENQLMLKDTAWMRVKSDLILNHGLFLTGLRIKEIYDLKQRRAYFIRNVNEVYAMEKRWYLKSLNTNFPFKAKLIFTLFKLKLYTLASLLYKS